MSGNRCYDDFKGQKSYFRIQNQQEEDCEPRTFKRHKKMQETQSQNQTQICQRTLAICHCIRFDTIHRSHKGDQYRSLSACLPSSYTVAYEVP